MGDRGQVKIDFKEASVYLYTHWGAYRLAEVVQNALKRKQRWNDQEYLARIIFSEMIRVSDNLDKKDNFDSDKAICDVGETGFGISTYKHDDVYLLVTITNDKRVIVEMYGKKIFEGSFDKFLDYEIKEDEK